MQNSKIEHKCMIVVFIKSKYLSLISQTIYIYFRKMRLHCSFADSENVILTKSRQIYGRPYMRGRMITEQVLLGPE